MRIALLALVLFLCGVSASPQVLHHPHTNRVHSVVYKDGLSKKQSSSLLDTLQLFMETHLEYGVHDAINQLKHLGTRQRSQLSDYKVSTFQQVYKGLDVLGADLKVVHGDDHTINSVNGHTLAKLANMDIDVTPKVSEDQVVHTAISHIQLQGHSDVVAEVVKTVLYDQSFVSHQTTPSQPRVLYQVNANSNNIIGKPSDHYVYVDAQSGLLSHAHMDINSILTQVYDANGELIYDNGTFIGTTTDTATSLEDLSTMAGTVAQNIYSMYQGFFGLDSYDKQGSTMVSRITDCDDYAGFTNAVALEQYAVASTSDDEPIVCAQFYHQSIVAHEWGHIYGDYFNEDKLPLMSASQAGAINEHYADLTSGAHGILYGDEGDFAVRPSDECSGDRWKVHFTYNPGSGDQTYRLTDLWKPDCLVDLTPVRPVDMSGFSCLSADNGKVHFNSDILNRIFARWVDGDDSNDGAGLTNAMHVWWDARSKMSSVTDFSMFADYLDQSCSYFSNTLESLPNHEGTFTGDRVLPSHCDYLTSLLTTADLRVAVCSDETKAVETIFPRFFPLATNGAVSSVSIVGPDSDYIWCKTGDDVRSILSPYGVPGRVIECPIPNRDVHVGASNIIPFAISWTGEDGDWITETSDGNPMEIYYFENPFVDTISPRVGSFHSETVVEIFGENMMKYYGCLDSTDATADDCLFARVVDGNGEWYDLPVTYLNTTSMSVTMPSGDTLAIESETPIDIYVTFNGGTNWQEILHYFSHQYSADLAALSFGVSDYFTRDEAVAAYNASGGDPAFVSCADDPNYLTIDPAVLDYTCDFEGSNSFVMVESITPADPNATVEIQLHHDEIEALTPGVFSHHKLRSGYALLEITVTSYDNKNQNTYLVVLFRGRSEDATIASLVLHQITDGGDTISPVALVPGDECPGVTSFEPDCKHYNAFVSFEVEEISVALNLTDEWAVWDLRGSGDLTQIGDDVGVDDPNEWTIAVTAEDPSSTDAYILDIYRAENTDSTLYSVGLTSVSFEFDPATLYYEAALYGVFTDGQESTRNLAWETTWPSSTIVTVKLDDVEVTTQYTGDSAVHYLSFMNGVATYNADVYVFLATLDATGSGLEVSCSIDFGTYPSIEEAATQCNVCFSNSTHPTVPAPNAVCDTTTTVTVYRVAITTANTPSETAFDVSMLYVSPYVTQYTDGTTIDRGEDLPTQPTIDPSTPGFDNYTLQNNLSASVTYTCPDDWRLAVIEGALTCYLDGLVNVIFHQNISVELHHEVERWYVDFIYNAYSWNLELTDAIYAQTYDSQQTSYATTTDVPIEISCAPESSNEYFETAVVDQNLVRDLTGIDDFIAHCRNSDAFDDGNAQYCESRLIVTDPFISKSEMQIELQPWVSTAEEADASLEKLFSENCNGGAGIAFEQLFAPITRGNYSCMLPYAEETLTIYALPNSHYASVDVYLNGEPAGGLLYPRHDNPLVPTPIIVENITAGEPLIVKIVGVYWEDLLPYTSYENYTGVNHIETVWEYQVEIYRQFNDDDLLDNLTVSDCTLRPAFQSTMYTGYSCDVPYESSSVNVAGTPRHSDAVASADYNADLSVAVPETLEMNCTAHDGTVRTYEVTVTRQNKTYSDLSALTVEIDAQYGATCDFDPVFDPSTYEYACTLDLGSVSGVNATITATEGDVDQHIKSGGGDDLLAGENRIEVVVTADDGVSFSFYRVVVTIADDNSYLAELAIEGCNFTEDFTGTTQTYYCGNLLNISVGDNPRNLLSYMTSNHLATTEEAGSTSAREGLNQLAVTVTASDGSQRLYTVWFMNLVDDPLVPSDCDGVDATFDCDGMTCMDLVFGYECVASSV